MILSIKEYPAWQWLLKYWYEHADELEPEYDVDYGSGTLTEEKYDLLASRYPDLRLEYCDEETLLSLPEEDRKLYAEIIYSWLITRINAIKQNFGCSYLYCVVTDTDAGEHPYESQVFLMSAADPGAVRGTEYEQVYILGVTVSVKEKASLRKVMRLAVERADDTPGSRKNTVGEETGDLGNYLDYYTCLDVLDGRAVLIGATYGIREIKSQIYASAWERTLTFAIYAILLLSLVMRRIFVYMLRPLKKVLSSIRTYTINKDSKAAEESLRDILSGKKSIAIRRNEIGQLSEDFVDLTKELDDYTSQIEKATADRKRIEVELETAAQIQAHMLPDRVPEFPDHPEFELYASMLPAKEIGGDFYDYFLQDPEHLVLVIADVSGKGIPAALSMAETKSLIKGRALMGEEPAEILYHVNNQLIDTNKTDYFVTVWLAVIDLKTGEGLAANAGHEHPVLGRNGEPYQLVVYKHSIVVGGMENTSFRQHSFKLNKGDHLFVYTDGVPEATNAKGELFGTDRMLEALNRNRDAAPEELLSGVSAAIDEFVGDAPQFDDTTMMCLQYLGKKWDT